MNEIFKTKPLIIDNHGKLRERDTGRMFHIHGINFASNTKLPTLPSQNTHMNVDNCGFYESADTISFVGRPFPLSSAYEHISRIKQCGFNTIRMVTTWEAIEHEGPGIYDVEYADYLIQLLKVIEEIGGIYVFIDPHQDVWSRFSGGSGAPIWTLYAAGLEPKNFENTLAAKLHHFSAEPEKFTKMVWATNYNRLASKVMFTCFFTGSIFTPNAIIDDKNIQNYLQDHFIDAYSFLIHRIKDQAPEIFGSSFLGVESMNEPNGGYFGFGDLNELSHNQNLRLDETPSPIQAFRLGMGYPEQVDTYSLSIIGPTKNGTKWVDPLGTKAWVTNDDNKDKHYGFKRSSQWRLGECIFAQHGVWDSHTGELIKPEYFKVHPETGEYLNDEKFINGPFLKFWHKFKTSMREIDQDMFLILQPPVLEIPPKIANNLDYLDDKTMLALHYYDGMSLMFQKWNRILNVDTLGIMRGKYINPIFGLVLGENNIRKSIRKQLKEMATESQKNVGYDIPVIFTETGMPFNMDNKRAYIDGNYTPQQDANDAILSALENEQLNFTYWCYNPENCHEWGDLWNLEDFSIFSKDDFKNDPFKDYNNYHDWVVGNSKKIITEMPNRINSFNYAPHTGNSNDTDSIHSYNHTNNDTHSLSSDRSISNGSINKSLLRENTHKYLHFEESHLDLTNGLRAKNAIIRPVPVLINGEILECEFNIHTKRFHLKVNCHRPKSNSLPDIIVIPKYHYDENKIKIVATEGTTMIKRNQITQWIEWDHNDLTNRNIALTITLKHSPNTENDNELGCGGLKGLACGYL